MERATEIVRKMIGADEQSVSPPKGEPDRASYKHIWMVLAVGIGMIIFGIVIAFTGLFSIDY